MWQLPSAQAASDEAVRAIAVIYPDIGEPYRTVFSTIIGGIEDQTRSRVASFPVGLYPWANYEGLLVPAGGPPLPGVGGSGFFSRQNPSARPPSVLWLPS